MHLHLRPPLVEEFKRGCKKIWSKKGCWRWLKQAVSFEWMNANSCALRGKTCLCHLDQSEGNRRRLWRTRGISSQTASRILRFSGMLHCVFRQIVPGVSKNPSAYVVDSNCPSNLLGIIDNENLKSRMIFHLLRFYRLWSHRPTQALNFNVETQAFIWV